MTDVAAPPFCDLVWHSAGPSAYTAWKTPLYEAAVARAGHSMELVGFDLQARDVALDLSACADIDALARRLAVWTGAAHRSLAHTERRDAVMRPLPDAAIQSLQDGLTWMIAEAAWAFGARLDLAERFAGAATLTRRQHDWACDILGAARTAVESVDARLATPAGAKALERAYDAGVRAALLEACRELTALDADRCREANGQGWGAVSSGPGHRLAGLATLSVLQAAHALGLVHPHRRQLSPDLRQGLFGPVNATEAGGLLASAGL